MTVALPPMSTPAAASKKSRNVGQKEALTTEITIFAYTLSGLSAIGGFLFGYDTGFVSGAMLLVGKQFQLNTIWHEIIVSGTVAAAWAFSLVGGYVADSWGRKTTVLIASTVFFTGSIIMGIAPNKEILLIGRVVVGIGIGLSSMSIPVYIAECSHSNIRGVLVTVYNLGITMGQFISGLVCGSFSTVDEGWRYMLALAAVPAGAQFIGLLFMPESPRFLLARGRISDAEKVLVRLRGRGNNTKEEVKSIQASFTQVPTNSSFLIKDLYYLFCGYYVILAFGGPLCMTGSWYCIVGNPYNIQKGIWQKVFCHHIRLIYLAHTSYSCFYMFLYGPIFHGTCSECIDNGACGFCFRPGNMTCLSVSSPRPCESSLSSAILSEGGNAYTWASNWCPSEYSWIPIVGLCLYLLFFAPGLGATPWTINSEIHPMWARGVSTSITTACNWLCNLIISLTFLSLTQLMTTYGAFFIYAGISFLGFGLLWEYLPETGGICLENMATLFGGSSKDITLDGKPPKDVSYEYDADDPGNVFTS